MQQLLGVVHSDARPFYAFLSLVQCYCVPIAYYILERLAVTFAACRYNPSSKVYTSVTDRNSLQYKQDVQHEGHITYGCIFHIFNSFHKTYLEQTYLIDPPRALDIQSSSCYAADRITVTCRVLI
jgi:hypothetical protein